MLGIMRRRHKKSIRDRAVRIVGNAGAGTDEGKKKQCDRRHTPDQLARHCSASHRNTIVSGMITTYEF